MLSEPLDRRTCSWAPFQVELQAQEGVAADFCRRSSGCEVDPVGLLVLRSRSSQEDEGYAACARGSDATVEVLIANDAGAVLVIVLYEDRVGCPTTRFWSKKRCGTFWLSL